ncbi:hypothetical protein C0J52_03908 [Blattella germanica]|nr:hypothetical protein C0J52_03908 [Blattella germanica]
MIIDGRPGEYEAIYEVAASKAAIVGSVAKEYERRANFSSEQAKALRVKADKFKFYMEQFSKRLDLLHKKIDKHKNLAKLSHSSAHVHEKKAGDFASKARTSREKANQLEVIKSEYLRRANNEYRSYSLAKIKAQVAHTRAKDLEAEVQHYLDWASDLLKKCDELRKASDVQKKHASESKNKAEKEIKSAQLHEKDAGSHLSKAKAFETKAGEITLKIKEAYRLYEEFMASSANENNVGKEKRVKATDEEIVAKVYGQAAVDMKTTYDIQKAEYTDLKNQADAADKAAKLYIKAAEEVKVQVTSIKAKKKS